MVIHHCYTNWQRSVLWVKTHSDGLSVPWNLFPALTICLWHSKNTNKSLLYCAQVCLFFTHIHTLPLHPVCLASYIKDSIFICCVTPADWNSSHVWTQRKSRHWGIKCINGQNISTELRWVQVKAIISYWIPLWNQCSSQKKSKRVRCFNCIKEAATQCDVQNILHIRCRPFWHLFEPSAIYLSLGPVQERWGPVPRQQHRNATEEIGIQSGGLQSWSSIKSPNYYIKVNKPYCAESYQLCAAAGG